VKKPEHCGSPLLFGFDKPLLRALMVGGRAAALGARAGKSRLTRVFKKPALLTSEEPSRRRSI